jgi:hypothetical protein
MKLQTIWHIARVTGRFDDKDFISEHARLYAYNPNVDYEHNLYWYTDGNFGCDCNRCLLLPNDKGYDLDNNMQCNDGTNRIQIKTIEPWMNGELVPNLPIYYLNEY